MARLRLLSIIGVAAVLLVLIGAAWWLFAPQPEEDDLELADVHGVACYKAPSTTASFTNANVRVKLPCDLIFIETLVENARGTYALYEVQTLNVPSTQTRAAEFQFYSRSSLTDFYRSCQETGTCAAAHYTPQDFIDLQAAYENVSDWKTWHMFVFNDRNWLVADFSCGDSCVIREYVSFRGNTMMALWIQMSGDNRQEEADQLFGQFAFL